VCLPLLKQSPQCSRVREKLTFVTSVASVILMAYTLVVVQWLLPYYYVISAPLLIGLRICLYMYVIPLLLLACLVMCSLMHFVCTVSEKKLEPYVFHDDIAKSQHNSPEVMVNNWATTVQNFVGKFWKMMELLIAKFLVLKSAVSSIAILE